MILLDTHAWLWWASASPELPSSARESIGQAVRDSEAAISCISAWEISLLLARNRLELAMRVEECVEAFDEMARLSFIPVTNPIGLRAVALPASFHSDPADRIIVATAQALDATLITRDARIRAYAHVRCAW